MTRCFTPRGGVAYALIYFTFFLDNVLLTVLVPIVPELLGDEDWSPGVDNSTATEDGSGWGVGAVSGAVLGAKAGAQLVAAREAARLVLARGSLTVLRASSALLLLATTVLMICATPWLGLGSVWMAWCLAAGRAVQGGAAAGAGVAGLALAAELVATQHKQRAIAALLGATALGVLVGYPLGGAAYQLWSRAAPFHILTVAAAANLVMQCTLLDKEDFDRVSPSDACPLTSGVGGRGGREVARCSGAAGWTAGAVLLTTSVMAALEPCLPIWITHKFHPQRWTRGVVFVPDSLGYLLATAAGGVWSRAGETAGRGAEMVAVAGQVAVGLAALTLPLVTAVSWLAVPHLALGLGLGSLDAALVPALLARCSPPRVPAAAALLQRASSAAYTLGPVVGGVVSWCIGFDSLLRTLAVLNLLYAAALYQHPLSQQWDAPASDEEDSEEFHLAPLTAHHYTTLREEK